MTEKTLIRYRRRNGSSFAILGNGWRYDGSSVIDATSDLELELKLAQARYDDRWVTMEGNHVLIGGNGLIKAGVGGRLKGRKFGMRFKDYEHGKVSKNGKRLVRPYKALKGQKTGETHAVDNSKSFLRKELASLERKYVSAREIHAEKSKVFSAISGKFHATNRWISELNDKIKRANGSNINKLKKDYDLAMKEFKEISNVYEKAKAEILETTKTVNKIHDDIKKYRAKAVAKGMKFVSDDYHIIKDGAVDKKISSKPVLKLKHNLSETEIITKVGGPDQTKGSCVSVALAYIANKQGLDVTDFRGGESQNLFARTAKALIGLDGIKGKNETVTREVAGTVKALKTVEKGKEYFLAVGKHAAVVRRNDSGFEYLELQSVPKYNGWQPLTTDRLSKRFGAAKSQRSTYGIKLTSTVIIIEVDSFKNSDEFRELVSYINTSEDKQKKGRGGYAK